MGSITITRNEAGALCIEAYRADGTIAGIATYKDKSDWAPALDHMISKVL